MNGLFNNSQEALQYLQRKFGSTNYKSWQTLRKQFYSYVQYTAAGNTQFNFFGTAIGGVNRQLTNIPKAGSIGQNHFLIKGIKCSFYIQDEFAAAWAGTNATSLASDLVNGFAQGGVLEILIGSRLFVQVPKPFLYAPPADGEDHLYTCGLRVLTLVEAMPNTYPGTNSVNQPRVTLNSRTNSKYLVDPNIFLEAEQQFEVRISYPTGAIAQIATSVINDTTNPLFLGVTLDGVLFRPVQ